MTQRKDPPFRADHVGSLLRPKSLTDAFKKHRDGEIGDDGLTAAQDKAIRDVITRGLPESPGAGRIMDACRGSETESLDSTISRVGASPQEANPRTVAAMSVVIQPFKPSSI